MVKKLTLEQLARMIEKGFQETATKREFKEFRDYVEENFKAVEERFDGVDSRFNGLENKFDAMYEEFREIKTALPPLVRIVSVLEIELNDLRGRVKRIEKKLSI